MSDYVSLGGFNIQIYFHLGGVPEIGVPQNGWFIRETLIKMNDLGAPPFKETPILLLCLGGAITRGLHPARRLVDGRVRVPGAK